MTGRLLLRIDERWSVSYEPSNNDRPVDIFRNGEFHSKWDQNNMGTAMFYALLDREKLRREREDLRMFCKGMARNIEEMLK